MTNPAEILRTTADAVAALGASIADFEALTDGALLDAERIIAEHRRQIDVYSSWVASQIAHRSRRELGYTGLAQRTGFLSPEALIQAVSGSTKAQATKFVRVGAMMADAAAPELADSELRGPAWAVPIAHAMSSGQIGLDSADAIRRGLGECFASHDVAEQLSAAVLLLVREAAGGSNADQLFRHARQLRDQIDSAGVAARQQQQRDQRYVRAHIRGDGMIAGSFLYPPEEGGLIISVLDTVLSPRRGGPRFVDDTAAASAEELLHDPRTNEQIAADAFFDLIRLALAADAGTLFPSRQPAVRVIVTETALATGAGFARLEGHTDAVSIETADRFACVGGVIGVKFDRSGQCVDLGRTQRLFSEAQRIGISVRDGGCVFPDCDRPPSACETHHINQWARDRGLTNIADGVLLCRRHHLLLHNNHWRIVRTGSTYWIQPPSAIDPRQKLIPLHSRTPEVQEMRDVDRDRQLVLA